MFALYTELPQSAFPAAPQSVALLPLAAVESHGPHLPLGTDGFIVEGIADRAAALDGRRSDTVLRLPTLWYGASEEHAGHRGTLSNEPERLVADIAAVGEGLAQAGVRRIVLFNGHGGNVAAASIAALRLRTRCGMLAAAVHWLDFGLPPGIEPPAPAREDVHGGWIETSALLHLAPRLVARRAIAASPPRAPAPSLFPSGPLAWGWMSGDLAPGGWIGHPELADADLGNALVDHAAHALLKVLAEIAAATWPTAP